MIKLVNFSTRLMGMLPLVMSTPRKGRLLRSKCVGANEGRYTGCFVCACCGAHVGSLEGSVKLGFSVDGLSVGCSVGTQLGGMVCTTLGIREGSVVGVTVGNRLGLVGTTLGSDDGCVGSMVGINVGPDGSSVGCSVGCVGAMLGNRDGEIVGVIVGNRLEGAQDGK